MFFLYKPSITYRIPNTVQITRNKKNLTIAPLKFKNSENINDVRSILHVDGIVLIVYMQTITIQPLSRTKKSNLQLCGLYKVKLKQYIKQAIGIMLKKTLFLKGIGFKALLVDNFINLKLGFSHEVLIKIPKDINVKILKSTKIVCSGIDLDRLSQFIYFIKSKKPVEPYKGKGILFLNETVRKKEGKKTKK
mgnify:CR=1 FL=1